MAATAVANKTSAREGDLRAQGEAMDRRSRSKPARATGLLGSKVQPTMLLVFIALVAVADRVSTWLRKALA